MSVVSDIAFQRAKAVRVSRRSDSGVRAALLPRPIRRRRSGPHKYPISELHTEPVDLIHPASDICSPPASGLHYRVGG